MRNGGLLDLPHVVADVCRSYLLSGLVPQPDKADQSSNLICFLNAIELLVLRERHGCEFMPRCGRSWRPVSQWH